MNNCDDVSYSYVQVNSERNLGTLNYDLSTTSSHTLNISLSLTEAKILELYCNQHQKPPITVVRELISALSPTPHKPTNNCKSKLLSKEEVRPYLQKLSEEAVQEVQDVKSLRGMANQMLKIADRLENSYVIHE